MLSILIHVMRVTLAIRELSARPKTKACSERCAPLQCGGNSYTREVAEGRKPESLPQWSRQERVVAWTRVVVMGVGRSGQIPRDLRGNGTDLEMDWLWRMGRRGHQGRRL